MTDLKPNAQEDKDAESVSDSPGHTQEPLQSHTFSLKNNAAGLSSDEHENPLNGTQPNPFVYRSVPAVPHAGNSLPSGALVNGPASHPTSEVHCVLNKGTVLSNNVLDAAWQVEKDTSPEVLPPPSELQSDAWKNTAGSTVKTLATQPGVNTPLSHSEENESKLACSTLSGDGAEQMHISQPLTKQTMKTRSQRDVEWSESSSDDYDDAEVIRWDSGRKHSLHSDRRLETKVMHQREMKPNTHVKNMSGSLKKVNNSQNHTNRRFSFQQCNNVENVDTIDTTDSLGTQSHIDYPVVPYKELSRRIASDFEPNIYSQAQEDCNEENDPKDEDKFNLKVEQLKTEEVPLSFSCTICNVNFKEQRHFHRHMMYHLGKHNQVSSENVSQPSICKECGRLFCDSNSLMSHIIIHQERLEKLMEEIKVLKNSEFKDRGTAVQCPRCVFGCSCPKIFVQHAKTHDNLKHYYFCEECNYITLTQQALETHLHVTHLNAQEHQYREMTQNNNAAKEESVQIQPQMGKITSRDKVALEGHSEVVQQRSSCSNHKNVTNHPKNIKSKPHLFTSNFFETAHCFRKIQQSNGKTLNSPKSKCCVGCAKNMHSPSLWRVDKHGKLLLQPVERLNVATDHTCAEEDTENNDCKAFGSSKQANCPASADFLLSARNLKLDQMLCQASKNGLASGSLQAQENQISPSMRKMSTPLHNTIDDMNGDISPQLSQRLQKQSANRESEKSWKGRTNFSDDTSGATGSFLESSKNERNPYARRYFRKRQRFSVKDQSPHVLKDKDNGDEDCSDIEQLIIKEEYVENTVYDDALESSTMPTSDCFGAFSKPGVEHKPCPYCPATFESGVGLSNHVRGHLHRVGLSYNARHMVSPEQVALQDHQPRTRRRVRLSVRRMKKAVKSERQGQHTCPLCSGWFDSKTGLSNHVRGHLKRIGGSVNSTSKSPLCILNELLQDQKEHRKILQVLSKSQFSTRPSLPHKWISSNDLILMHSDIPLKIRYEMKSPQPIFCNLPLKQEKETFSENNILPVHPQNTTETSTNTLVKLLKMRQKGLEPTVRNNQEAYATKRLCELTKDHMDDTEMTSVELTQTNGECRSSDFCIQCNGPFPILPSHLRLYANRKRIGIFEEPAYDYREKKPRPRPGLKKKIFPSLNAEMYTLTCRFCDLVFHGPLSVQEDWIKHLQRHLLHNRVPRSGTGMVEVLGLHQKIQMSMSGENTDFE